MNCSPCFVVAVTVCIFAQFGATHGFAFNDARLQRIVTVSLADFDVSHEIECVAKPAGRNKRRPRVKPGYDDLRLAFRSSSPNSVAALLSAGADPNGISEADEPILFRAVWAGHLEQLHDLLNAGADPNRPDADGKVPLQMAVSLTLPRS
jgi:hypothetical protein